MIYNMTPWDAACQKYQLYSLLQVNATESECYPYSHRQNSVENETELFSCIWNETKFCFILKFYMISSMPFTRDSHKFSWRAYANPPHNTHTHSSIAAVRMILLTLTMYMLFPRKQMQKTNHVSMQAC